MGSQFHLRLSAELLAQVNAAAKANYISCSDYIRQSLVLRLSEQPPSVAPAAETAEEEAVKPSEEEFLKQLAEHYGS